MWALLAAACGRGAGRRRTLLTAALGCGTVLIRLSDVWHRRLPTAAPTAAPAPFGGSTSIGLWTDLWGRSILTVASASGCGGGFILLNAVRRQTLLAGAPTSAPAPGRGGSGLVLCTDIGKRLLLVAAASASGAGLLLLIAICRRRLLAATPAVAPTPGGPGGCNGIGGCVLSSTLWRRGFLAGGRCNAGLVRFTAVWRSRLLAATPAAASSSAGSTGSSCLTLWSTRWR